MEQKLNDWKDQNDCNELKKSFDTDYMFQTWSLRPINSFVMTFEIPRIVKQ